MKQFINITNVEVIPRLDKDSMIKGDVWIELNDSIGINNIKIMKSQYGHFISYPKNIHTFNHTLRKTLQTKILQEYAKQLAAALPSVPTLREVV